MKKSWKILSLLLIFLLMGCASRQSAEEAFPVPTETAGEPSKSADSGTTLVSSEAQGETTERLVVKRAEMRVSVADPAEAMRTVVQWAESMQGYVVNSNQWNSTSDGQTRGIPLRDRNCFRVRKPPRGNELPASGLPRCLGPCGTYAERRT